MGAAPTPPCSPGQICSKQFGTKIEGTNLYFATATTISPNNKGKTTLNYWNGSEWKASATSENGDPWKPTTDTALSPSAVQSLINGDLGKNASAKTSETLDKASVPKTIKDNVVPGSKNKASSSEQESKAALQKELKDSGKLSRFNFPKDLRYPSNLQINHQDVIKFSMLKYEPRSFNESANQNLGSFSERSKFSTRTIGSVFLPIPGGISDTNSVTWGSDTLTAAQKALANFANSLITGGAEAGAETAERTGEQMEGSSVEIRTALAAYFTEQATGASNILSRTEGAIQNPNMELLFSGPTLRPFNFTFKLSARGTKDRDQIRQIIRFFKQGMAVQRTESQLFLKAPHTFKIQYLHKNKDHSYINLIKECALQSFTVNYTPEGNYMTFADGSMVSYEIQMQFTELEPIFNDDYSKFEKDNQLTTDQIIGY